MSDARSDDDVGSLISSVGEMPTWLSEAQEDLAKQASTDVNDSKSDTDSMPGWLTEAQQEAEGDTGNGKPDAAINQQCGGRRQSRPAAAARRACAREPRVREQRRLVTTECRARWLDWWIARQQ